MSAARPEVEEVPRVEWEELRDYFAREHELGEHVAAAGATGEGKTTTLLALLEARGERTTVQGRPVSITAFEVKRRDATMSRMLARGWHRVTKLSEWPPAYGEEHSVVWPPAGDVGSRAGRMRGIFEPILNEIDASGNQIVFIDEAAYFERPRPNGLGLARYLEEYWGGARSNGISLVAGTQRPVRVSRSMWSEPSWLLIFALEDEDDVKVVASRARGFKDEILAAAPTLEEHEFMLIRRRPRSKRFVVISKAELQ